MKQFNQRITNALSTRISLKAAFAIALLLLTALFVMYKYSRKVMREEAMEKAVLTLGSTLMQIDNVMLNVEQASGNVYTDLLMHLDRPELLPKYTRNLIESSPYIRACAIVFEPGVFTNDKEYYSAYSYRDESNNIIEMSSVPGDIPYKKQKWYQTALNEGHPFWFHVNDASTRNEAVITFSLPIYMKGKPVGVMGIDMPMSWLSEIVDSAKLSPNSYAILVDKDGSYIVHPDPLKVSLGNIITPNDSTDASVNDVGKAMIAGATDYRAIMINGEKYYIFFRPFKRSAVPGRSIDDIGWSVGVLYAVNDIFGDYMKLLDLILLISVIGILLFFISEKILIHSQLSPLNQFTILAKRIADGDYNTPISDCHQEDEVGALHHHFKQMQKSLSYKIGELKQLRENLEEKSKILSKAYVLAKEADRMKTAFLHNMTNQMIEPANIMSESVEILLNQKQKVSDEEIDRLVDTIHAEGSTIAEMLDQLIKLSRDQERNYIND